MTKVKPLVDELVKDIARKFYWLWKQKDRSQTKWTEALIDEIGGIGVDKKYKVYAKNFKKGFEKGSKEYGEWLFDMTWIDKRNDYDWEVVMAMESEWDPSETAFRDDFEKLMVARCRLRVMSFTLPIDTNDDRFEDIKEKIKNYSHTAAGDCYLCVGWPDDKRKSEKLKCEAFEVEKSCGSVIFRNIQLQ